MITVTLNLTKYAFVDANAPNTPSTGKTKQQAYYSDRTTLLLFGLSPLPNQYKFRGLGEVRLNFRADINDTITIDNVRCSLEDFDPSSVTYNTRPAQYFSASVDGWFSNGTGSTALRSVWASQFLHETPGAMVNSYEAGKLLNGKTIWLDVDPLFDAYPRCEIYTPSSGYAPYITVQVADDLVHLKPTISGRMSGYINPHDAVTLSWANTKVYPSGTFSFIGDLLQTGAEVKARASDSDPWTTVATMQGADTEITIPAEALPIGDSVQIKLTVTDSGGTSTDSAVKTIDTQAATAYAYPSWPVGAIVDNTLANTFRWSRSGNEGDPPKQGDAQWSSDGGSTWNDLTSVNGFYSFSVPANTLPVSSTLSWRVRAYNNDNVAGPWSSAASFTTVDSTPVATPISPVSTVEDGSAPIRFSWNVRNQSGSTPTKSELQWAPQGGSFTTFATINGSGTSYTAPGGTFTAGKIYWRVRSYNRQNTAGSWSSNSAYSFICVTAPATPSLDTAGAPFATFDWQAEGQQAWRLTVDGKLYGPYFGTGKTFTLPDYLEDGEHAASVEVQGQYGLWSQPGTITFDVANVPGDGLTLQGSFGVDAALRWSTESATADFLVYRDGVQIGHTASYAFLDRLVLGTHAWRVINRLPDGNYTASNEVSGTLRSCTTQIAPAEGGDWLPLALSENSRDEQIFNWSRMHSLRHFAGAEFPVLEISPYADLSGTYDTAFACLKQAQAFEALRGRVVILKSRGGTVLIGALTEIRKRAGTFSLAYEFTVQRCHWEDYVDDTDG